MNTKAFTFSFLLDIWRSICKHCVRMNTGARGAVSAKRNNNIDIDDGGGDRNDDDADVWW